MMVLMYILLQQKTKNLKKPCYCFLVSVDGKKCGMIIPLPIFQNNGCVKLTDDLKRSQTANS